MLKTNFIRRKIKLIQEDLRGLEDISQMSYAELSKDLFKMMATERLLERIITRAIDINQHLIAELGTGTEKIRDYHDTFLGLADLQVYTKIFAQKIAPSAGLRNVLVHEYDEVDEKLIYESMHHALKQYPKYCQAILDYIDTHIAQKTA